MVDIENNNNEVLPPPKRRRISPTPVDPSEDTKQIPPPAYFFLTRDEIIQSQIREAETRQHLVENGICWQEDYARAPMLEPSAIADIDLPPEMIALLTWSGPQKATFIELIGRKTAAALSEIACIVGKSVLECQTYLEVLQQNSEQLAIDYAEIPAAEEIPAELGEPELGNLDQFNDENLEIDCNLFVLKRLNNLSGKNVSPKSVNRLREILRSKVTEWIKQIFRQSMLDTNASIGPDAVEYAVTRDIEDDEVVGSENIEVETADEVSERENENEHENENDDEAELLNFCKQEEIWLDRLDIFNSMIGIHSRGLLCHVDNVRTPEPREQALEKFMQSR